MGLQGGVYTGRKPPLTIEQVHQLRQRAAVSERKSVLHGCRPDEPDPTVETLALVRQPRRHESVTSHLTIERAACDTGRASRPGPRTKSWMTLATR